MVRQTTNGEVETGNVDESARYFNYLRTLADLTAIASIVAVQVMSRLSSCLLRGRDYALDISDRDV
jgi:hypothetical protein